jgi:acyl-CoA synthetase (AMP-forming)/AMP-acid ligase II/thioesterase domain-containing protein/acyl carrier protein
VTSITAPAHAHWTHVPAVPPADDHSVLDRWDRVVAAHPDSHAISGAGTSYTFAEADRLTDALAQRFTAALIPDDHTGAGVGAVPGGAPVPVGIMAGHTPATVLGVVALIKAGRLVVVLDPHMPENRLKHIVELSGMRNVIADPAYASLAEAIVEDPATILPYDRLRAKATELADGDESIERLPVARERGGTDELVIVFTSGSTGLPKGVVITHRLTLLAAEQDAVQLRHRTEDRYGAVFPLSFVAGVIGAISGLLCSIGLVMLDPRDVGAEPILDWLVAERITTIGCTPHLLRALAGAAKEGDQRMRGLRWILTGGEAVTGADIDVVRPLLVPEASYFNEFGSSEAGVVSCFEIRPGEPVPAGIIPAGRITLHHDVVILREDGTEADVGEIGEIISVSRGMTSGYWNAPAETAKRLGTTADRIPTWRQGDLGRIEPDGTLVQIGRADDAVKVRGYLVEPIEIEAAVRRIDGVQDVVVVAIVDPPAPTRLVAYVAGRRGRRTPAPAAIRRTLRGQLPEYMVPSTIVSVAEVPRNERGKVDRAKLPPAPNVEVEMVEGAYDQWELVVGQIWSEVLGLRGVGLDEDFSALGGDSLLAEEMLAVLEERLGVDLRASDLLEHPTLREFAARVRLGTAALPRHPDIVKVSTARGSDRPAVFCFAGSGALALTFLPLSRQIPQHDVYALQQHGLDARGIPDWSIERSARRHLALMRIAQPRGPYLLVGHSLGGLVAMEVARQLVAAGEAVEHVVLIDSYLPMTRAEQGALEFGRLEPRRDRNRVLVTVSRTIDKGIRRFMPSGIPHGEILGRRVRAYGAGVLRYGGQKHFDAMFDQGELAARGYRLQPYDGAVTYVVAENNPDIDTWTWVLRGPTEIAPIAGEHSSILREPHVSELGAVLRTAFGDD